MIPTLTAWTTVQRLQLSLVLVMVTAILAIGAVGPVMAEADGCQQLLINGDMETNAAWSVETNGAYTPFSNYQAHSGQRSAYLAGVNNAVDVLRQTVSLPANQGTTLRFWWLINTEESSDGWDGFTVQLASADGAPQRTLFAASERSAGFTWQQTTIDLSEFAGQTVQLLISARTDAILSTDFFVDDMTLTSCDVSNASGNIFFPILRR